MLTDFVPGPFKIATRFLIYRLIGITVCVAAVAACLIGYSIFAWDGARGIRHDQRIWNEGGPLLDARFKGEVTTRQFVLKSYALEVAYETPDGQSHKNELKFDTLFGGLADDGDIKVRVSPNNPDDFALNLAVDASGSRWASVAFFGVIGIFLLGGCFGLLTYTVASQTLRVRAAAKTGLPMLCTLLRREAVLNQGKPTGAEKFRFKIPALANHPEGEATYQCHTKKCRALTLANDQLVLAIVPPQNPSQAIILLEDYYPFVFSEAQKATATNAVQAALRAREKASSV